VADGKIGIEIDLTGDADVKIRKLTEGVQDFEVKAVKGFQNSGRAFDTFKGVLAGEAAFKAIEKLGGALLDLFKDIVVDGIKSAEAYEVSLNRLNVALAQSGQFSAETSKDFEDFAASIQATTKFSDDAVLSSTALLQTIAKLGGEDLKQAETGVIDLAAALNIDLDSAAQLVGKALEGNVAGLQRYGIAIRKGADETQTQANVMKALADFAGTAAGQVNTFSGAVAQLTHAQEDSHKGIGQLVTQNVAVVDVLKELTAITSENTEESKKNAQAYRELVAQGVIILIKGFEGLLVTLDAVARISAASFAALTAGVLTAGSAITGVVGVFSEDFKKKSEIMSLAARDAGADIGKAFTEDTKLGDAATLAARLEVAATKGFEAVKSGAIAAVDPINRTTDATSRLTDAQVKLGEEGVKVAEHLAGIDPSVKYEKDLEALNAANEQGLELRISYNEAVEALDKVRADRTLEIEQKKIDQLLTANESLRFQDQIANADRIAKNNAAIQKIVEQEQAGSNSRLVLQRKVQQSEAQINEARLSAAQSVFGEITATTNKETAAYKAAAIAQATISTYEGASKAASALAGIPIVGPALAAAAAGVFIAGGLARVAAIVGTPLATGIDTVPGTGTRDNFPALLQPGERVVPTETNRDLKSFLAGDGPMTRLLQSIDEKISRLAPQTIVTLDGREIFNSIRNQLNAGRTLA
jgi:hypothetical protein